MKMTHRPRTSSLFLLELIFSILFFSVASAICIQIFVRAHTLSRDARALHTAVSACSDAAEIGSNAGTAADAAEKLAACTRTAAAEDPASDNDSVFTVADGFDAELQPCRGRRGRSGISADSGLFRTRKAAALQSDYDKKEFFSGNLPAGDRSLFIGRNRG